MIIAKDNEEKRSQIWRIVTGVSSVLIILIVIYFFVKALAGNPIQGTWVDEDSNVELVIKNASTVTLKVSELAEESQVSIQLGYSLDKEDKIFTINEDTDALKKVADQSDGAFTEEALEAAIGSYMSSFTYSIDGNEMTLTEREYGDQISLTRK